MIGHHGIALACGLTLTACAAAPRQQPNAFWYVNSTPTGAIVTTSEGFTCVTPCRLDIPRWRKKDRLSFTYTIQKEGFQPVSGTDTIKTNSAFVGELMIGALTTAAGFPLFPPLSDKGAIMIDPNPIAVTLTAIAPPVDNLAPQPAGLQP